MYQSMNMDSLDDCQQYSPFPGSEANTERAFWLRSAATLLTPWDMILVNTNTLVVV
jgi:hypothetical protein